MAGKKTLDIDSKTALMVVGEEKNIELLKQQQQESRERMIAQSYEMAGQIRTIKMVTEFGDITRLVWLKQVKESKIYRDLPGIGTWEEYCKYVGVDRHTTDQDLLNIATFGETFLAAVTSLNVGYRDLRKLRQLSHDGTITIDADAIEINGDRIPLDSEHKEDLQTAIEQIIEEQARIKEEQAAQKKAYERVQGDTHKSMTKLQKDLDKFTAAAADKGLTPDEDAFLKQIEAFRITFDCFINRFNPADVFGAYDTITPRMQAGLISALHYMKMEILSGYDIAVTKHGNPAMNPELLEDYTRWQEEFDVKA